MHRKVALRHIKKAPLMVKFKPGFYGVQRDLRRQCVTFDHPAHDSKPRTLHPRPDAAAVEQLRQEIESAVGDLGLEHHSIQVGAAVSTLPAGSFVILRSETAPTPELAGTVKEVVNSGLFAKDESGRPHFISPSKINVYKL
jgi:hypothetical protein